LECQVHGESAGKNRLASYVSIKGNHRDGMYSGVRTSRRYDAMSFLWIISSLLGLEVSSPVSVLFLGFFSVGTLPGDRIVCRSSRTSLAKVVTKIAISCVNSALSASLIFDTLPVRLPFKG
jgi:hypothetical protein